MCDCAEAPLMAFHLNALKNLIINKRPAQVTHTNDISIHFQTFRDNGVLFTTSNEANNDYIKAYVENGQVHVDLFIERAGRQVRFTDCHRFSPEKFFTKLFERLKRRRLRIKSPLQGAYPLYHL